MGNLFVRSSGVVIGPLDALPDIIYEHTENCNTSYDTVFHAPIFVVLLILIFCYIFNENSIDFTIKLSFKWETEMTISHVI